jgi:hypothetical protein
MLEELPAMLPKLAATVDRQSLPLDDDRWTPIPALS